MADIKRRFIRNHPVELRDEGDAKPTLRGIAAVYYDAEDPGTEFPIWNGAVERIQRGAFDRAAKEDDVIACFNHDPSQLLGRTSSGTLQLQSNATGLGYQVDLGNTRTAQDVQEYVARGDITGSSFAFSIQSGGDNWTTEDRDGKEIAVRNITDVRLYDVSPVTTPAYQSTSVGLRSDIEEARSSYDAFRGVQPEDEPEETPKEDEETPPTAGDWRTYKARLAQHGL